MRRGRGRVAEKNRDSFISIVEVKDDLPDEGSSYPLWQRLGMYRL